MRCDAGRLETASDPLPPTLQTVESKAACATAIASVDTLKEAIDDRVAQVEGCVSKQSSTAATALDNAAEAQAAAARQARQLCDTTDAVTHIRQQLSDVEVRLVALCGQVASAAAVAVLDDRLQAQEQATAAHGERLDAAVATLHDETHALLDGHTAALEGLRRDMASNLERELEGVRTAASAQVHAMEQTVLAGAQALVDERCGAVEQEVLAQVGTRAVNGSACGLLRLTSMVVGVCAGRAFAWPGEGRTPRPPRCRHCDRWRAPDTVALGHGPSG